MNMPPERRNCWEETFAEFSYEIRKMALKYPADVVKKKMKQSTVRESEDGAS